MPLTLDIVAYCHISKVLTLPKKLCWGSTKQQNMVLTTIINDEHIANTLKARNSQNHAGYIIINDKNSQYFINQLSIIINEHKYFKHVIYADDLYIYRTTKDVQFSEKLNELYDRLLSWGNYSRVKISEKNVNSCMYAKKSIVFIIIVY